MKKSKIVSILIGAALFLAVALPVVFLEAVIGGFIMKLFGFHYDSMKSVFLFFLVAAVADAPLFPAVSNPTRCGCNNLQSSWMPATG